MLFAFQLIPDMTLPQLSIWGWMVGIGAVLGSLLLFVRRRPCLHDLEVLDSVHGIVQSRCRKCRKVIYEKFDAQKHDA